MGSIGSMSKPENGFLVAAIQFPVPVVNETSCRILCNIYEDIVISRQPVCILYNLYHKESDKQDERRNHDECHDDVLPVYECVFHER